MTDEDDSDESPVGENDARDGSNPPSDDERTSAATDAVDSNATNAADSDATDTDASQTDGDSRSESDAATVPDETERTADDGGGFLSNLTNPREQLGEAAAAFKNARGASALPEDEEGRVKLVCRRHAERRAVPLDDVGRPSCYEKGHPDCEGCLEDVRDGTVETF